MIVAIAGLPGCGKSRLVREYEARGFAGLDDINANSKGGWIRNITLAKSMAAGGRDLVISDVMFCEAGWRERLESDLGVPVHWVCFENAPERCAANCRTRAQQNPSQILAFELGLIERLAPVYQPIGEIVPVITAGRPAT